MFIAMNRFQINAGREADFEARWRERDSYLNDVPGFERFALLKGESNGTTTEYVSHSTWRSRADFDAWTKSDAFTRGHADGPISASAGGRELPLGFSAEEIPGLS